MHIAHDPASPPAPRIAFDGFLAVDIRVGTIVAAHPFPDSDGKVVLVQPSRPVPNGGRLY